MELSEKELKRISDYMKSNYGVDLAGKYILVSGRLENKLSKRGFTSYDEFMDKVESGTGEEEKKFLINTLTTNHTYFMREPVHFDFLREVALPKFRDLETATHDIRIWSAASSSGEEAYSIVMCIKEFFGIDSGRWDTTVLATDISTQALMKAKAGRYRAESVEELPEKWVKTFFKKLAPCDEVQGVEYEVKPEYRKEVVFNTFNLMDPFRWKKKFHIIFLRNVMIYFDEKTKLDLVRKMTDYLVEGGYLIIGTTETIDHERAGLVHVRPSVFMKPYRGR